MKRISSLLIFLAGSLPYITPQGTAQVVTDMIFESYDVQKLPSFPGGEAVLMKYIFENVHVPSIAREQNIPGTFGFRFNVGKDGSISAIDTLKGGGPLAEELILVIKSMPCWMPAERNGKPVSCQFTLPIRLCFR